MPSSSELGAAHVVIPARWASTRLPGKPLIDIGGQPMVVRVIESVSRALPGVEVIVATDDPRILDAVAECGARAEITGADCESGTDRVAEVAARAGWGQDDLIINVQGDEPLLPPSMLAAFHRFCVDDAGLQMATIAVPVLGHAELADPNVVKVVRRLDGSAAYFSRGAVPVDRDLPPQSWPLPRYRRHIGIYAYRHSVLKLVTECPPCEMELAERLEQLRALWLGVKIDVLDWEHPPPPGVDTPADVEIVRREFAGGAT